MWQSLSLVIVISSLVPIHASWISNVYRRGKPSDAHESCGFEISSTGTMPCPAGQLPDGQIRLNGSYPTSKFFIDANGGITDTNGFGCIVTGTHSIKSAPMKMIFAFIWSMNDTDT